MQITTQKVKEYLRIEYGDDSADVIISETEEEKLQLIIKKINDEKLLKICPNLIIKKRAMSIKNTISKNEQYASVYDEISKVILTFEKGSIIKQTIIKSMMGLSKYTRGDLLREYLDLMVCNGLLSKTEFKTGKGGHTFVVISHQRCPYFSEKIGCTCTSFNVLEKDTAEKGIGVIVSSSIPTITQLELEELMLSGSKRRNKL